MSTTSTVRVDTASASYEILIGTSLLGDDAVWARLPAKAAVLVVSNTTVAPLHASRLMATLGRRFNKLELLELPDGEAHKTWASVERIVDSLLAMGADRDAIVVALGGGVVGDLAGFAAACYMRGVACVQVPTTLLAAVDSSVGGKTGVNHVRGKNLLGAIHQPMLVVTDLDTLATLPEREYRAGVAEIVKTALVADAAFFEWLEANLDRLLAREHDAVRHAVSRCCAIKAEVVGEDEREAGRRAILNFGHTFGHAVEAATRYASWLHGEAVACGMRFATRISVDAAALSAADAGRIDALLERTGLPLVPPPMSADAWLDWMRHDKKTRDGALRFVLLDSIGTARLSAVSDADVRASLDRAAVFATDPEGVSR